MAKKKKTESKAKPATLHKAKHVDESKPLAEGVTPKADEISHQSTTPCKECSHGAAAHYGSANRWCNISGCQCQEYR